MCVVTYSLCDASFRCYGNGVPKKYGFVTYLEWFWSVQGFLTRIIHFLSSHFSKHSRTERSPCCRDKKNDFSWFQGWLDIRSVIPKSGSWLTQNTFQTGPPSITIKCSNGASNDPMSPYSTEYSARIGIGQSKEHGPEKRNRATGYKSNFRPGVYYSTKLDRIDNEPMIGILDDFQYVSETAKCFADPMRKRASGPSLPVNLSQKGSGFTRLRWVFLLKTWISIIV